MERRATVPSGFGSTSFSFWSSSPILLRGFRGGGGGGFVGALENSPPFQGLGFTHSSFDEAPACKNVGNDKR